MKNTESYQKRLFAAIIIIALGISLSTTLSNAAGSLGTVLIAVGGLLFISGMAKKRSYDEKKKSANAGNTN
jgi:hypothetical protein